MGMAASSAQNTNAKSAPWWQWAQAQAVNCFACVVSLRAAHRLERRGCRIVWCPSVLNRAPNHANSACRACGNRTRALSHCAAHHRSATQRTHLPFVVGVGHGGHERLHKSTMHIVLHSLLVSQRKPGNAGCAIPSVLQRRVWAAAICDWLALLAQLCVTESVFCVTRRGVVVRTCDHNG